MSGKDRRQQSLSEMLDMWSGFEACPQNVRLDDAVPVAKLHTRDCVFLLHLAGQEW